MKSLDIERLAFRALTSCVLFAFIVSGSLVTFATTTKPVGEILVTGVSRVEGKSVTVNGEPVKTGRTVFSSSVINTPEGMSAVLNLGKAGRIQLEPGSSFAMNVEDLTVNGSLTSGSLSVLSTPASVGVKTLSGNTVELKSGESISASAATASKAKAGPGGMSWAVWAAIIGGAAAAVILVVVLKDDDTVTSPVR